MGSRSDVILLAGRLEVDRQRYADALVKPGDIFTSTDRSAIEGSSRRATLEQDSGAQGA